MTKKIRSKSLANSIQSKQAGVRYFLACITTGLQLLDMISRAMFQTISPVTGLNHMKAGNLKHTRPLFERIHFKSCVMHYVICIYEIDELEYTLKKSLE